MALWSTAWLTSPGRDGYGDILEAQAPWNRDEELGILILGHLDTVHPIGSLATTHTFRREGDQVFGPGIYDMKAGSYMAYYVRAVRAPMRARSLSTSARSSTISMPRKGFLRWSATWRCSGAD
jgi:hypothetical protein